MALDINLTLSDDDLSHFTDAMRQAQESAKGRDAAGIIADARKLLQEESHGRAPDYIRERLDTVESMIDMASDAGFALPEEDCHRVLAVLAYFADPVDFIPDTVPALGFLGRRDHDRTVPAGTALRDRGLRGFLRVAQQGSAQSWRGPGQTRSAARGLDGSLSQGNDRADAPPPQRFLCQR